MSECPGERSLCKLPELEQGLSQLSGLVHDIGSKTPLELSTGFLKEDAQDWRFSTSRGMTDIPVKLLKIRQTVLKMCLLDSFGIPSRRRRYSCLPQPSRHTKVLENYIVGFQIQIGQPPDETPRHTATGSQNHS